MSTSSSFKNAEKRFKAMNTIEEAEHAVTFRQQDDHPDSFTINFRGRTCRVVPIPSREGAYIVCDALCRRISVELIQHCVADCLLPPNLTNLHAHSTEQEKATFVNIWSTEKQHLDSLSENCLKLPKSMSIMGRMRWVTLGYQYDWSERKYYPEAFVPFPSQLAELCKELGQALGTNYTIDPQAAIVNFYPENAVMGGHVDDAEWTYDHPVYSISLGSPCVFLLGGSTKDTEPVSMILRSGDILVMGQSARLAVHGVPKVFSKAFPPRYLHPNTAGQEKLHLMGCPLFLQGNERICDGTGDSSSNDNNHNQINSNDHDNNHKRSASSPSSSSSSSSKRQKQDHPLSEQHLQPLLQEHQQGNHSDRGADCACACGIDNINGSISDGVVSGRYDALRDESRVLRFLQTTRININVRQVTTTADVGQATETANDTED